MNALAPLLSKREIQVMQGVVEGFGPTEIADIMRISPKTVSAFRSRIIAKLGARNAVHSVVLWVRAERC